MGMNFGRDNLSSLNQKMGEIRRKQRQKQYICQLTGAERIDVAEGGGQEEKGSGALHGVNLWDAGSDAGRRMNDVSRRCRILVSDTNLPRYGAKFEHPAEARNRGCSRG